MLRIPSISTLYFLVSTVLMAVRVFLLCLSVVSSTFFCTHTNRTINACFDSLCAFAVAIRTCVVVAALVEVLECELQCLH